MRRVLACLGRVLRELRDARGSLLLILLMRICVVVPIARIIYAKIRFGIIVPKVIFCLLRIFLYINSILIRDAVCAAD